MTVHPERIQANFMQMSQTKRSTPTVANTELHLFSTVGVRDFFLLPCHSPYRANPLKKCSREKHERLATVLNWSVVKQA